MRECIVRVAQGVAQSVDVLFRCETRQADAYRAVDGLRVKPTASSTWLRPPFLQAELRETYTPRASR